MIPTRSNPPQNRGASGDGEVRVEAERPGNAIGGRSKGLRIHDRYRHSVAGQRYGSHRIVKNLEARHGYDKHAFIGSIFLDIQFANWLFFASHRIRCSSSLFVRNYQLSSRNHCRYFADFRHLVFSVWIVGIHRGMKEGEKGYALTLLGLLLMVVATVASIGWQPDPKSWSFHYANQKVGFIFNTGLVLFSLGLSTREQHNTKLAYAVTLAAVFFGFGQVFFVLLLRSDSIFNVAGGLLSSWGALGAFLLSPLGALGVFHNILYFVVAVWSITLGLKLRKTIQPSNASYSKVTPTDY